LVGMISNVNIAKLPTDMVFRVVIFSVRESYCVLRAVQRETGTLCLPAEKRFSTRNKWLASGSLITGVVKVDTGAIVALKRRGSLLAVGLMSIQRGFEAGEVIQIEDPSGAVFAVAKAKMDSSRSEERRVG